MVNRKTKTTTALPGVDTLSLADIRLILRLATELHDLPAVGTGRRERLSTSLCQIIGADACESAFFTQRNGTTSPLLLSSVAMTSKGRRTKSILHRGTIDSTLQVLLKRMRTNGPDRRTTAATLTQTLAVSSNSLFLLQTLGIKEVIYSVRNLSSDSRQTTFSVLCVAWQSSNPQNPGPRECRIVDLLHAETPWIRDAVTTSPARATPFPAGLTARQTECLQMLLTGQSEKQIADKLNISHHTVHIYVKNIYRAYGTVTRGELMACFLPGGRPSV